MSTPAKMSETYPLIYKRTNTGDIQEWHVERQAHMYRSITGKRGGKMVTAAWTECESKNVGKRNEINAVQQAHNEVLAMYKKKLRQDFYEDLEKIDNQMRFLPMLAKKFSDYEDRIAEDEVVYYQPKFDGFRCIANKDGLWTRDGLKLPTAPHIEKALLPLFSRHPHLYVDGELYNHDLHDDFNSISSMLRKKTPSIADLLRSEENVEYHTYDMPDTNQVFLDRLNRLNELITDIVFRELGDSTPLRLVETTPGTVDDAIPLLNKYLEQGYEGGILRRNAPYQNKRSEYLLKIKKFLEEEFQLLRIEEGRGSRQGIAARAYMQTADGKEFKVGIIGSHEFCRELLENESEYRGKMGTVQFLNYTPGGKPRGGKLKTMRWA
jgi:DNA ligase-1